MPSIEWIKLTTTMFDDDKIRLIESMPDRDTLLVIWVKLLTQAGKCNASGHLILSERIAFNDEMLATIFNRPVNTVRLALKTFEEMGMIERDDTIYITNWEKHQNIETMDKIRELTRIRVQKHRENKKQLPATLPVTLRNAQRIEKREEEKELKTLVERPADAPTVSDPSKQQHSWLVGWYCWAFAELTGEKYLFSKADAKIISTLLKNNGLSVVLERSTYWLLDEDRFPRGSPTIKGLLDGWNRMAARDGTEDALKRGLLPPEGTSLKTFTPWKEQQT